MLPGQTALTRMRRGASSRAAVFVRLLTAAFVAPAHVTRAVAQAPVDAVHVQGEDTAQLLAALILDRGSRVLQSRVVDQDVELAQLPLHVLEGFAHRVLLRAVHAHETRSDRLADGLALGTAAGDRDPRPRLHEVRGHGPSDSRRATRHEGRLPRQREHAAPPSRLGRLTRNTAPMQASTVPAMDRKNRFGGRDGSGRRPNWDES
jgi:hypothetical protein